jgi:hypothetical protein
LGDDVVSPGGERRTDEKFQLAGLVAAGGQTGAIVALYSDLGPAERIAQPCHGLKRSGRVAKAHTREARKLHVGNREWSSDVFVLQSA